MESNTENKKTPLKLSVPPDYMRESYQNNNYCFWDDYLTDVLIESGTYLSSGVFAAISKGVPNIHTMEIDPNLYQYNLKYMFSNLINNKGTSEVAEAASRFIFDNSLSITYYCGDSCEILPQLMPQVDMEVSFWLDGHVSNTEGSGLIASTPSDIGGGQPLMKELEIIKNHRIKTHRLMLDIDCPKNWNRLDEIKEFILSINPEYKIKTVPRFYFDDEEKTVEYMEYLKRHFDENDDNLQKAISNWKKDLPDDYSNNVVLLAKV